MPIGEGRWVLALCTRRCVGYRSAPPAVTSSSNRSKELHLKNLKTSVLALLFVVVAAATSFAQAPQNPRARQPQQRQQAPQQVIPPGSTPIPMTDEEIKDLSSFYKDGHIILLQEQVIQGKIDPLQGQIDGLEKERAEWRAAFLHKVDLVKIAHKWGPDVVFDNDSLGFVRIPASAIRPATPATPTATPVPAGGVAPTPAAATTPAAPAAATPVATPATPPAK
jgi:hypothetical protein